MQRAAAMRDSQDGSKWLPGKPFSGCAGEWAGHGANHSTDSLLHGVHSTTCPKYVLNVLSEPKYLVQGENI